MVAARRHRLTSRYAYGAYNSGLNIASHSSASPMAKRPFSSFGCADPRQYMHGSVSKSALIYIKAPERFSISLASGSFVVFGCVSNTVASAHEWRVACLFEWVRS